MDILDWIINHGAERHANNWMYAAPPGGGAKAVIIDNELERLRREKDSASAYGMRR